MEGGGTECERGVFHAKRKRERVSAEPIERHQKERSNATRSGAFAAKPLKAQVTHRAINTVLLLIQHIGGP